MSLQLESEARAAYPYATSAGFDFKAWAKRIIYREEHGDKELTSLQVKFAREAMDMKDDKAGGK